jgi:deazaflavin-dependent oxidoreductase (nitroreductase family)
MAQTDFSHALQGIREIEITVTGRKTGQPISLPVWFVQEGETLYLLPAKGAATEWYKNLLKTPTIRLAVKGMTLTTSATPSIDEASVREVVEKFRDKYGAGTVNSLYSGLDAGVEMPLT